MAGITLPACCPSVVGQMTSGENALSVSARAAGQSSLCN